MKDQGNFSVGDRVINLLDRDGAVTLYQSYKVRRITDIGAHVIDDSGYDYYFDYCDIEALNPVAEQNTKVSRLVKAVVSLQSENQILNDKLSSISKLVVNDWEFSESLVLELLRGQINMTEQFKGEWHEG